MPGETLALCAECLCYFSIQLGFTVGESNSVEITAE